MTITSYLSGLVQDYLRPNLFSVFFDPNFISPYKIDYSSILVRSCQFPGQTINTTYIPYNNKKNNFATTLDLDPISMDIYCDTGNKAHSFFLHWQSKIIAPSTRIMGFKEDYVGKVDIEQHGRLFVIAGIATTKATLINAFPVNVSPIELAHDSVDDVCRFNVSFQYDDVLFTHKGGIVSSLLSLGIGGLSLL